jgi:DNA-binding PadR family transcriptional regulator
MSAKLTATSFALLSLLARRDWSAYELNSHMQRSTIRVFWPRAQSHVYSEPKKLLQQGLVSSRDALLNGRERTIYSITAKGREALKDWLASADEQPLMIMQSPAMLKFLHADASDIASMQRQLDGMLAATEAEIREAEAGVARVLTLFEDKDAVPGMAYNGEAMALMAELLVSRYEWLQQAKQHLAGLEDTQASAQATELGKAAYRQALQRLQNCQNSES